MDKKQDFQEEIKIKRVKEIFNQAVKIKDQNHQLLQVILNLEDSKLIKVLQNNLMMLKTQSILGKICL